LRSFISNFWFNSSLICKSLFWSLHTKMKYYSFLIPKRMNNIHIHIVVS
jgi:hypothetical protein